jgi:negative regulator of flagellin synthesis FlgM
MVEVIKNSLSRMEPRKSNTSNAAPQPISNSAIAAPAKDSVELKSAENMSAIKEMAASVPIDRANVNRIKDAIKRGEYPIDFDRISDALLEAYKEMKSS